MLFVRDDRAALVVIGKVGDDAFILQNLFCFFFVIVCAPLSAVARWRRAYLNVARRIELTPAYARVHDAQRECDAMKRRRVKRCVAPAIVEERPLTWQIPYERIRL